MVSFVFIILIIFILIVLFVFIKNRKKYQELQCKSISDIVNFIAHQWRQPLNKISSLLLSIRKDISTLTTQKKDIINGKLDICEDTLEHLSSTMENFKNFYENDSCQNFLISDAIYDTLEIIRYNIDLHSININLKLDSNIYINGKKSNLMHSLLSILTNSIEIIDERKIQKPEITISLFTQNNNKIIKISDNAGGIDKDILPKIFDKLQTTKKSGTGMGLYISQIIVKEKFNGKIFAQNIEDGAEFIITFKK